MPGDDTRGDQGDIVSFQVQRPPEGMPNPQDAPNQMNFLSVPAAVYVDDDSISTMSAETTTILTRSHCGFWHFETYIEKQ